MQCVCRDFVRPLCLLKDNRGDLFIAGVAETDLGISQETVAHKGDNVPSLTFWNCVFVQTTRPLGIDADWLKWLWCTLPVPPPFRRATAPCVFVLGSCAFSKPKARSRFSNLASTLSAQLATFLSRQKLLPREWTPACAPSAISAAAPCYLILALSLLGRKARLFPTLRGHVVSGMNWMQKALPPQYHVTSFFSLSLSLSCTH